MNIWFSSDTHFNHAGIIQHAHRPYETVDEMNEKLIENWNRVIKDDDYVYHLGDFAFGGKTKVLAVLSKLNGKKYLIRGNHDEAVLKTPCAEHFQWIKDYYYLKVPDVDGPDGKMQSIILCHFPFASWNHMHHGAWHLHGHCHGNLKIDTGLKRMDVGVDPNFQKPVSYRRIKEIMATRVFTPVDHHGAM